MKTIISIIIFSMAVSACSSKGTKTRTDSQIDSDRLKAEQLSPSLYLNVTGQIEVDRINCSLENLAKLASYRNIVIGINYFTDTRELIRSDIYTIDITVPPMSTIAHTLAIKEPPINYSIVSISTRGADGVE